MLISCAGLLALAAQDFAGCYVFFYLFISYFFTSWRFRDQGTVKGIDRPDHVNGEMAVPDNDASRNLLASE